MTVSYKERISRGLDSFAVGMWPVINDAMTRRSPMGGNWTESYPGENLQSDASARIGVILDNRAQIFRLMMWLRHWIGPTTSPEEVFRREQIFGGRITWKNVDIRARGLKSGSGNAKETH